MRHVDNQRRIDPVCDLSKPGKIYMARIGRAAGDDYPRLMVLSESFHLINIDFCILLTYPVLHRVEPFSRLIGCGAMGEVAARGERHSEQCIARLHDRHIGRLIGLRT